MKGFLPSKIIINFSKRNVTKRYCLLTVQILIHTPVFLKFKYRFSFPKERLWQYFEQRIHKMISLPFPSHPAHTHTHTHTHTQTQTW